jgi:hypothetical protein
VAEACNLWDLPMQQESQKSRELLLLQTILQSRNTLKTALLLACPNL